MPEKVITSVGILQFGAASRRINEIVHWTRPTSADTALRQARYCGTSEKFWLNPQARYDLEIEIDRLGPRFLKEVAVLSISY